MDRRGTTLPQVLLGAIILLCCSGARPLLGQEVPVFRARSNVVLVPVSVIGKHGEAIRGLSAKDFILLVDGRVVSGWSFDEVVETSTTAAVNVSPLLPKNVLVNIPPEAAQSSNLVVLLIDYLNTRQADRMVLREQALRFLAHELRPNQEIAVYGLTYSLVSIHPFTSDSARLAGVAGDLLRQKGVAPDAPEPRPLPPEKGFGGLSGGEGLEQQDIDGFLLRSARRAYNLNQLDRAARTLMAFRQLASAFSGVPGKKSVIWLTGDASPLNPSLMYQFRLDNPSLETIRTSAWDIARAYEALNGSGISLFPLDIRGNVNRGAGDISQGQTHTEFRQSLGESGPGDVTPYSGMTDFRQGEAGNAVLAMQGAAAETGGMVLQGSNDLGKLLDRAQGYWGNYYVLGFVPPAAPDSPQVVYHRIEVKVKRAGTHVLARRGFVSRPETLVGSETEIQRDIAEAANSPIDLTSLPLELRLGKSMRDGKKMDFPYELTIRGDALSPIQDANGFRYELTVVTLVRTQDGTIVSNAGEKLASVAAPGQWEAVQKQGLSYKSAFHTAAGGVCTGRIIVRDNHTGQVGTITLQLPAT